MMTIESNNVNSRTRKPEHVDHCDTLSQHLTICDCERLNGLRHAISMFSGEESSVLTTSTIQHKINNMSLLQTHPQETAEQLSSLIWICT